MSKIMMKKETDNKYVSESGLTLEREYGKTPNGNDADGRWVLRDGVGRWLDMDKYSNDLADRNDLDLYSLNKISVEEISINGEDHIVLNGATINKDLAKKYYGIDSIPHFKWGDVIDRFTYNFDGVQFMVIKYHPFESANGGASLNSVGNKDKVLYFNDFVAEMNESLIYIILLILTKMQLGENQRALAKGMAKALNEKME